MSSMHQQQVGLDTVQFNAYHDEVEWSWAVAVALSAILRRELLAHDRARLLLSGGGTPGPVYRALSKSPLEWLRVDVALVDERWLRPDDSDSNAHLVRTTLLQQHAAAARLETLTRPGRSIEETVSIANLHAHQPATAVVLGMGPDGHVASLFPGMRDLDAVLHSNNAYATVDASGCIGAGPWLRRITLTPAGLAPAQARLLLIRGDAKRRLFERALEGDDPHELPVRIAFTTPGASLQVYWCP